MITKLHNAMTDDLCTSTENKIFLAQSAGVVEYTDCFSAEGSDPLPMSVLDMI